VGARRGRRRAEERVWRKKIWGEAGIKESERKNEKSRQIERERERGLEKRSGEGRKREKKGRVTWRGGMFGIGQEKRERKKKKKKDIVGGVEGRQKEKEK
jgi:hypothetical protein